MSAVAVPGRYRSPITFPEYRLGKRPPNYGRTYPAETLTRDEIRRLLVELRRGYAGDRDAALVVLMWRCGLRVDEALSLLPKDVDLAEGTVTVLRGKGSKRRMVGIDPEAGEVVAVWLSRRAMLGLGPRQPLCPVISQPTRGKKLYASCLRKTLKLAGTRAGIEKRVHPHGLRHTFASELEREGVPLPIIQQLLGHEDIEYTVRYIHNLYPAEAIATLQRRRWDSVTAHEAA